MRSERNNTAIGGGSANKSRDSTGFSEESYRCKYVPIGCCKRDECNHASEKECGIYLEARAVERGE